MKVKRKISFEQGFNNWMNCCLKHQFSKVSKKKMNEAIRWLNNLSDNDYKRLIS